MRSALILPLLVVAIALAACSSSAKLKGAPSPQPTFPAEGESPAAQLLADLRNWRSSSARVSLHASLEGGGESMSADVVWYTDGANQHQRFDFDDAKSAVGLKRAQIFTEGYKDRIIICSHELPVDPEAELGSAGPKGACCEGSSSCGDWAGNTLYFLGFPLGISDEPGDWTDLEGFEISVERRQIAGTAARCYRVTAEGPDGGESEQCFSPAGAKLYWKRPDDFGGTVEVKAYAVGAPIAGDFDYPYPVYLDPNESR